MTEPFGNPYLSHVLQQVVKEFTYKPGWHVYIGLEIDEKDGSGGWQLFIVSNTENSRKLNERIRVRHPFLIPAASYDYKTWCAWVFDRCIDVERHEAGEFALFNGERLFAPHHGNGENPYITWFVGDSHAAAKRAGDD